MAVTLESTIKRYIGISTDTKPTAVAVGSTYWAYDTQVIYKTYDGTNWAVYDTFAGSGLITGTFTSSAATTTTITAAALADVAGQYIGQMVLPLTGAMAGEGRYITAYNGTTQLTVSPAWASDPDAAGAITFAIISGSNSIIVTALGTNGSTVTDSATTVLGAIGANNADNAFSSSSVVSNADGSVLEREQFIQEKIADIDTIVDEIDNHLHAQGFKTIGTGTFTTASTTVPADTGRTEADGYWDSCWLVPTQAAETEINQPRQIASYAQTGGVFTMQTGTTWLTAPAGTYKILSNGTGKNVLGLGIFTTSSTSVPADTRRGEVTDYWNGCQLLPLTGIAANQPRNIALFTATTGVFSLPSGALFTTAPGTVTYAIVRGTQDQVAVANATSALTYKSTIGNKADSAHTGAADNTTSLVGYAKQIIPQTDLILPGVKLVTKTSTSTLTTGTLFNWAGSIQILSILGRVTTAIQDQATTCKLGIQADALTIQDICATLDIRAFLVGTLLGITGTYADAMIGTTGVPTKPPTTPINATCITSGIIKVTYGAASSGVIVWEILWVPLNAAGSVTAA